MRNSRSFQSLASLALVAFFICGQQAAAQEKYRPHVNIVVARQKHAASNAARLGSTLPANLYALLGAFTQTYPIIGANADGTDIWPCTGNSTSTGPDPDCPTIGDPAMIFPSNATVIGNPAFVWQLNNTSGSGNGYGCNALTNGTGHLGIPYFPCGQVETWYEDDTNDTTDEILYSMTVTQGSRTVADSGVVDIGPNTSGGLTPPSDVLIYDPINLGYGPGDGPLTGPNNGNCTPNYNYPLTSPANPGEEYLVAAGKTCVQPLAGTATITVTTALGAPVYTQVMGIACTFNGVASPCYTVKWIKKYELSQKWNIWLE